MEQTYPDDLIKYLQRMPRLRVLKVAVVSPLLEEEGLDEKEAKWLFEACPSLHIVQFSFDRNSDGAWPTYTDIGRRWERGGVGAESPWKDDEWKEESHS